MTIYNPGNIKDHCTYENQLKHGLRAYIRSGHAVFAGGCHRRLNSVDDILDYIREMHDEYMRQPGSVENDCKYITTVCSNVLVSDKKRPQPAGGHLHSAKVLRLQCGLSISLRMPSLPHLQTAEEKPVHWSRLS